LLANVPLAHTSAPVAEHPLTQPPSEPAKKPTVLESLKEYMPKLPRR
jgi:hypothetical protein